MDGRRIELDFEIPLSDLTNNDSNLVYGLYVLFDLPLYTNRFLQMNIYEQIPIPRFQTHRYVRTCLYKQR